MSDLWKGKVTLVGAKLPTTTLTYDLDVDDAVGTPGDQFDIAIAALNAIIAELVDVTEAIVGRAWVTYTAQQSGILGAGDTTDCAAVSCYINQATETPKLHTVNIPAPVAGVFTVGDANKVDEGFAPLQDYIAALATNAFVSDGEKINLAIDNGIRDGYWVSKPRSMRPRR